MYPSVSDVSLSRVDPTITRSAVWLYSSWRWTVQCSRTHWTHCPTFVQQSFTETKKEQIEQNICIEIFEKHCVSSCFIRIGCNQEYAKQVGFGFSYFFVEILNFVKLEKCCDKILTPCEVKANAKALADTLMGKGHKLASDGLAPREQRNIVKPFFSNMCNVSNILIYILYNIHQIRCNEIPTAGFLRTW